MKLTWDDLIIQNISHSDTQIWIDPWSHILTGQFSPIFMSKFGDWFLRRPDGSTDELSVIEGTLQRISSTPEEFFENVNNVEWQEHHLLSFQIASLHKRGLIPGIGECYGFTPHPIWNGRMDFSLCCILKIPVWQFIASQSFSYPM
jgi:hypothetical protein